jgi:transposase
VPEAVNPRVVGFANAAARSAAWRELDESHGLIGETPVKSLTAAGIAWYESSKSFAKSITARQESLGARGLDAATIHHSIFAAQRDRVLEYTGIKKRKSVSGASITTGRPRFASRRDPVTSLTGSSSMKNAGALRVDIAQGVFSWAAAGGAYRIEGSLRFPESDGWLKQAVQAPIAQVRVLYRMIGDSRRWYVQLVLVGKPPIKRRVADRVARGVVGIDLGVRHVAAVGDHGAILADLASHAMARERKRDAGVTDQRDGDRLKGDRYARRMARRISRTLARHPENVDAVRKAQKTLAKTRDGRGDGRCVEVEVGFKKGSRLIVSERVKALRADFADVRRADAAARHNDHGRVVNAMATLGDVAHLERLSYVAMQKAFGRQSKRYAPGAFVERLRSRFALLGGTVFDIETSSTKLSQLCHACGSYTKTEIRGPIASRLKPRCECGREAAHRDLYSAFLARYVAPDSSIDFQAATADWSEHFELICGARWTYDRAEEMRLRVSRGGSTPISDRALVPRARVGAQAPAIESLHQLAPASVRDGAARTRSRCVEQRGDASLPRNRSTQHPRAFSPRSAPGNGIVEHPVRPPLDI